MGAPELRSWFPFKQLLSVCSSISPEPHLHGPFLQAVLSFQLSSQVVYLPSNELCSLGCPAPEGQLGRSQTWAALRPPRPAAWKAFAKGLPSVGAG